MEYQSFKEIPEYLNQNCGFCNTPVNFVKLSDGFYSGDNGEIYSSSRVMYYSVLYNCPNCGRQSLIIFGKMANYTYHTQFPKYSPEKMFDIPIEIESDRYEAWKCYFNGCFKSAAIMARASLQRAVRVLQAEGKNLFTEIEDLKSKSIITKHLADFAHEVRITGNDMAHPEDITEVNQKEIEESLDFLDGFLETVFVLPAIADKRKKAREGI